MIERLLSAKALKITAVTLLAVYLCLGATWTWQALFDPSARLGNDFLLFWSAARLTAEGGAVRAYDAATLLFQERQSFSSMAPGLIWVYPPPALLLVRPLALLPLWLAFIAWSMAGLAAYLAAVRVMTPGRWPALLALAFPGVFVVLYCGQTGLFVAAALGAGLWLVERRPWVAGVLIGLLACKPQFGVLLPLLLVGTGRWRTIAAAGATVIGMAVLSLAAFGPEPWMAFIQSLPQVSAAVTGHGFPLHRTPSMFALVFSMGATREAALAVHAAVAGAVALATLALWRCRAPHALKAGSAACAVLIATPYLWDYDLPMLAVAGAAIGAVARERALSLAERMLLLLIATTPLLLTALSESMGVSLTGLAVLGCWGGVTAMGWRERKSAAVVSPTRDTLGLAFTAS